MRGVMMRLKGLSESGQKTIEDGGKTTLTMQTMTGSDLLDLARSLPESALDVESELRRYKYDVKMALAVLDINRMYGG